MSTCRYHEVRFFVCTAPATHRLSFDTITGRCLGFVLAAPHPPAWDKLSEAVFCLTHAGIVSQAEQERWNRAQEAP